MHGRVAHPGLRRRTAWLLELDRRRKRGTHEPEARPRTVRTEVAARTDKAVVSEVEVVTWFG